MNQKCLALRNKGEEEVASWGERTVIPFARDA